MTLAKISRLNIVVLSLGINKINTQNLRSTFRGWPLFIMPHAHNYIINIGIKPCLTKRLLEVPNNDSKLYLNLAI
jgi:hypothetical protein